MWGLKKTISSYFFDRIVLIFGYIAKRTNTKIHGQVTIIFVVSVCLFVCLFVYVEFFSAVFDPISIKLGHILYVWV